MNWLFVFLPITIILEHMPGISPAIVFLCAGLAIIPVAYNLVLATEHLATYTGQTLGGFLNATFGNAPELIISLVALRAGYLDMVRASIIGAIIANLLLAQGISFFWGGLRFKEQKYSSKVTRMYSSMMMVAVLSLAVPSAFAKNTTSTPEDLNTLNCIVAGMLLLSYLLYLLFMLKTHRQFFSSGESEAHPEHFNRWSLKKAIIFLIGSSVLAAFVSEILVGAAESAGHVLGMSEIFIGVICLSVVGAAAEIASAVAMGLRNKMDLSIGIAMGSSTQIALFVAPLLVLGSYWIAPQPLILTYHPQALLFLLLVVLIGGMVSTDGQSNWYKGAQLIIVYLMLAAMFYLTPSHL